MKPILRNSLILLCVLLAANGYNRNKTAAKNSAGSSLDAPGKSVAKQSEASGAFINDISELDKTIESGDCKISYKSSWTVDEDKSGNLYFFIPSDHTNLAILVSVWGATDFSEDDMHNTMFQDMFISALGQPSDAENLLIKDSASTYIGDKKSFTVNYSAAFAGEFADVIGVVFVDENTYISASLHKSAELSEDDKAAFNIFLNAIENAVLNKEFPVV